MRFNKAAQAIIHLLENSLLASLQVLVDLNENLTSKPKKVPKTPNSDFSN